jgi:hypothetical protein
MARAVRAMATATRVAGNTKRELFVPNTNTNNESMIELIPLVARIDCTNAI